jgi:hypothetical protein
MEFRPNNTLQPFAHINADDTCFFVFKNECDVQINATTQQLRTFQKLDLNLLSYIELDNASPLIDSKCPSFDANDLLRYQHHLDRQLQSRLVYDLDVNLLNKQQVSVYRYAQPEILMHFVDKPIIHIMDANYTLSLQEKLAFVNQIKKESKVIYQIITQDTPILKFRIKSNSNAGLHDPN